SRPRAISTIFANGTAHEPVYRNHGVLPQVPSRYPRRGGPGLGPCDDSTTTPSSLGRGYTGTGLVIEALLSRFDDVIGVDNDADMLAAAEAALRPRLSADTTLSLVESTAENFSPPSGWRADLGTICRTFHWLDQPKILRQLDDQVNPRGAVAIFGDSSFWAIGSPWKDAVRAVIKDFLGEERRAGQGIFQHHDRPYNEFLEESAFNQVEEVSVPVHRKWTIESILGYLYSTS